MLQITERRLEVLRRIAQGETQREIACALHITPNSVRSRLTWTMQTLGARNAAHAVFMAVKKGLI